MPFFFVFVGVLLIVTGVKDTYVALGNQIVKDFTGPSNFFVWVLALGAVGSLGYVEKLRPFSNAFMVLILLAMVLTNSNKSDILTMLSDGLNNPVTPNRPASSDVAPTQNRASMAATPSSIQKGADYLATGAKLLAVFGF